MKRGEAMKRTLMAIAAAATLAVSTLAAPAPAHAQRGVAAGVAAGLIGGAIVGGAIASQNGYYGPGYYGGAAHVPGARFGGWVPSRLRRWGGVCLPAGRPRRPAPTFFS